MANQASGLPTRRAIFAATIGNGLEFYDFLTFAFFAIQIGKVFFPNGDPYLSLMGSLSAFGAGFIGRPLGAWILGGYADRIGRRPVMVFSMIIMGLAVTAIALTPPYATIGIAAPIIVVCARIVQGFALGAEVGVATAYLTECGSAERRGLNSGLQAVTQGVAFVVAPLVGYGLTVALTPAQLADFGWRIAMLLGAAIVPFAWLVRRDLPEPEPGQHGTAGDPAASQGIARVVLCSATLMAAGTTGTYFLNYTATFAQNNLSMSVGLGMLAEVATNVVMILATLGGGMWSDAVGRRPILIGCQVALIAALVPGMAIVLNYPSIGVLIAVNVVLSIAMNAGNGALYAAILESIDPGRRVRAFALIYAVPVTLFGGTTQLLLTWLIKQTGTPMSIAYYLTFLQVIGLGAVLLLRESAPAALARDQRKRCATGDGLPDRPA